MKNTEPKSFWSNLLLVIFNSDYGYVLILLFGVLDYNYFVAPKRGSDFAAC